MSNLPIEKATELKRLENIATEKRLFYESLDKRIFPTQGEEDITLLPDYTRAKKELTEAVNEYNIYKSSLATLYDV